jgi:uncharacterized coiled-coil DUF342 family protein
MDAYSLEVKIEKLIASHKHLKESEKQLKDKLEKQSDEIHELRNELVKIREDYNNLLIAKSIEVSAENGGDTRREIKKLVREIDKCIALLNT